MRIVVDAVDAPIRPEMDDDHLALLVSQFHWFRVDPFRDAREFRGGRGFVPVATVTDRGPKSKGRPEQNGRGD